MLIDEFNRVISYVRISVTDRCNLRCKYCIDGSFPFVPHDEILRYEEIIRFVRLSADLGISKVRLTGGEPLIRKGIDFLLQEINAIAGITDISLTTNGVYLSEKILDLEKAGLRRINVSLDTLKRDRFRYITGVDALDQVFMGIEKSIYSGLRPLKINAVIIKGFNDDEILHFARLAYKWDIHVRFIEFMPFGNSSLWDSSTIIPSAEIQAQIEKVYRLEPESNVSRGPAKMFTVQGGTGKIGFISPMSTHLCAECNRIRLTSSGMIRPCLFSDTEHDIKHLLRSNASDDDIKDRIVRVVKTKPERKFESGYIRKCQRSMRDIGG
jgi:cyclic pyranopterin phosphate synthase